MLKTMEEGCGIYREEAGMQKTLNTLRELKEQYRQAGVQDTSKVYNTELLYFLELGYGLDIAEATCLGALQRRESRGAHQRLDEGCTARNDEQYLQHSLVHYQGGADARLEWQPVDVSMLPPGVRAYGEAGKGDKA
jgi:fumarate reductase flavoprotein subunit